MRITVITSLGLFLGLGCGGGGSSDGGGLIHKDGAIAADGIAITSGFTIVDIPECGLAGYQTVAAAAGDKVYFATLATTDKVQSCVLEDRSNQTALVYDICVVSPTVSGFSGAKVSSQGYRGMMGVGLALDKAGTPTLAYTGGQTAPFRCGASDMLIATVNGAALGIPKTIAAGSASTGMPADQAANCVQDVCNRGDATGYWPSLALDPVSGTFGLAFRDLHIGFADTDMASSDVEFAKGDGYAVYTVDVARGGGTYARLAFSPAGKAAVVHYIEKPSAIWIDRETTAGWVSQKLFTGVIGEQLGFAISAKGLHALAYFDAARKLLAYKESPDGDTFTAAEDVDRNGVTGNYPSLAFDPDGNPAIAYYRCSDYNVTDGCKDTMDGLYLARRRLGAWTNTKVVGNDGTFEGMYTALAFVGGKAVIAYQSSYFDSIANTSKVSLHIAKEM